jgi:phage-related protein
LTSVVKYDNIASKNVYWTKAADKDFRNFPLLVQETIRDALAIVAEGKKADDAKPINGSV